MLRDLFYHLLLAWLVQCEECLQLACEALKFRAEA